MVTTRPPKTIVKPTALGPVANTDTKLLIYGLFQKGRVLAQDGESVLVIVKPETVVRWHRCGFRRYWAWKSRRRRPGRPGVAPEIRELIRNMSRANPLWGAQARRQGPGTSGHIRCSQPATSYLSPSARCAPVNGLAGCYVSTIGKPHEYFDLTRPETNQVPCARMNKRKAQPCRPLSEIRKLRGKIYNKKSVTSLRKVNYRRS